MKLDAGLDFDPQRFRCAYGYKELDGPVLQELSGECSSVETLEAALTRIEEDSSKELLYYEVEGRRIVLREMRWE